MQTKLTVMMTYAVTIAASQLMPGETRADPEPLVPLATATVTSNRPQLESTFGWTPVSIELCSDPACKRVLDTWISDNSRTQVRSALAPGLYFWRISHGPWFSGFKDGVMQHQGPWSSTRSFRVPARPREPSKNTAWGGFLDVNCDGIGDVAVASQDQRGGRGIVEVFYGSPQGLSASTAWSLPTSTPVDDLSAVGDLNNDGCGELGIVGDGVLAIHPGSSAGLGTSPWSITRPPDARAEVRLMLDAAGSLYRRGSSGLVVHGGGSAWTHRGLPDGSIPSAVDRGSAWTFAGSGELALETDYGGAADFDGDGYEDLVFVRSEGTQVRNIRIVPGGFTVDRVATIPSSAGRSRCIGDVDADGAADLLLVGESAAVDAPQSSISVHKGGSYKFPSSVPHQRLEVPAADVRIHCADVNGDGRDDLLARHNEGGSAAPGRARVRIYLAGPDGLLTQSQTLREEDFVGDLKTDFGAEMSASDLNGDGRLELVLTAPACAECEAGSGLLLIFADGRGDDLGRPTVRTGAPGFAQRIAVGFR